MVHSSIYTDLHRVCKASHVHSIFMLHALLLPQPSLSSNDFPCTAAYHADPTWSNWKCCGQLQSYKMTTWYVWSQKRCIRFLNLVLKKICAVLSTPCSSPQMWLSKRFSLNWSYVDVNLNASHVIGNPLLIPFNLQDLLRMSKSKGVFTRWHIFWPLKSTETNRISPTFTTAIQNLTLQHQRSKPSKNSINLNRDRNATLPHKKTISSRAAACCCCSWKTAVSSWSSSTVKPSECLSTVLVAGAASVQSDQSLKFTDKIEQQNASENL